MRRGLYTVLVVLALAGLAAYFMFRLIEEPAQPMVTPVEVEPSVISTVPAELIPTPGQGITPELIEVMQHGLPIAGCDDRVSETGTRLTEETLEQLTRDAIDVLSTSEDPEYLLAAALLDFDRDDANESKLLARAMAQLPKHPVALWHRLQHCEAGGCNRDEIAMAAVAADPTNGMLWLEIARGRLQADDWAGAERALQRAIVSSRFDTYFYDYALLIERGLAASTNLDYSDRVVFGIGVAAAVAIPSFNEVLLACQSGENDAVVWVPLCDELGKSMHEHSRELISTMIGWGYRQVAAERAGDSALVASLKKESEAVSERYSFRQIRVGASALLENDPTVLRNYLDDFRTHGELAAIDRLVDAAERLRADETYDQCNFVKRSAVF